MAKSISSLLVECLGLFNALVARSDLIVHVAEVPASLWTDELGRLRVWAANIGAHQTGQSSLDYRLRDASHIKDQVIRLLERLRRSLMDLQDALIEPPAEAESESSDDEDTTEFEQIYNGLVELINSLFQMSLLIRRPAGHDRLLGTNKEDSITFEPYDRKHVLEKYPRAGGLAVDRLGTAISRRRADLKYRERHRAKLSQGINKLRTGAHNESQNIHDRESTVLSDTIATDFKEPNIYFDDTGSDTGISQTSYAPTLLEDGKAIAVPPPPKESANEQPFECPYCFFISTIKNRRSWARHVFRDIMPYICIFAGCTTPNRLYGSRREWYRHISTTHMSPSTDQTPECPLCQAGGLSPSSFERHLGRHLEELALFALPRPTADSDVESGQSRHSAEEGRLSDVSSEEEVGDEGHADPAPHTQQGMICNFCDTEIRDGQAYSSCSVCTLYYCHNCDECLSGCRRAGHEVERVYYSSREDPYPSVGVNKDASINAREGSYLNEGLDDMMHESARVSVPPSSSGPPLAASSISGPGDGVAGGSGKNEGIIANLKRVFGFGRRQGGNETKDGASTESSSRAGTRTAPLGIAHRTEPIVVDRYLGMRDHMTIDQERSAKDPNQLRRVKISENADLSISDEKEIPDTERRDQYNVYGSGSRRGYGSGLVDDPRFDFGGAVVNSTVYKRTGTISRTGGQNQEVDLPSAHPTRTPPERSPQSTDNSELSLSVEDAVQRLVLPELTEFKKDQKLRSDRTRLDRDANIPPGRGSSISIEQNPERAPKDRKLPEISPNVTLHHSRRGSVESLSQAERFQRDMDFYSASEQICIENDEQELSMMRHGFKGEAVLQKDRNVQSSRPRSREISFSPIPDTFCRPARDDERYVMERFAAHASHCPLCKDPHSVYMRGGTLCTRGHAYARDIAEYVYLKDGKAHSVVDRLTSDSRSQIEIPPQCDAVTSLVEALEKGLTMRSPEVSDGEDESNPVLAQSSLLAEEKRNRIYGYDGDYASPVSPRRDREERESKDGRMRVTGSGQARMT